MATVSSSSRAGLVDVEDPKYHHQGEDRELFDPRSGVKRGLKNRHLSMMALAGIIGPGLLVGAGGALANGGPAALIIGFGVIAFCALPVVNSLGEMSVAFSSSGGFIEMADRVFDKAFAGTIGVMYFIVFAVGVLSNEYNVQMSLLGFWSEKVPLWGYFLLLWSAFTAFNLLGAVEVWGEVEFWAALMKIVGLLAYYLFSLVYMCGGVKGQDAIGFRYWHDPGAFSDGIKGVANVLVYCSTFYAGIESISVAAAETRNPSRAVPSAIKQVFARIVFVYMFAAFFYGVTCPYNDPDLQSTTAKAIQSPMSIAIRNAGWSGGVHLVNAFILITCISAANSSIYISSRTVFYMAKSGLLPKIFGYVDKRGVMIPAILLSNSVGALALLNLSQSAAKAYSYIVNISGVATFIVWAGICYTHLRFRNAWETQGYAVEELKFKAPWHPWTTYFGILFNIFLALIQGWATLKPFDAAKFVDCYILLPVSFILYFGYKFLLKTKIRKLHEVDLETGRRKDVDYIDDEESGAPFWRRIVKNF